VKVRGRVWSTALLAVLVLTGSAGARAQNPTPAVHVTQAARQPASVAQFDQAHAAIEEILKRDEFQPALPTWWDRQTMKLRLWIGKLFMGVDRLTTMAPWLGRALEWLFFVAAVVGLLVWFLRVAKRQRLRVALGPAAVRASSEWERDRADWQRLAEQSAATGEWREAIHALYWAAIVQLESRRAWRPNPTRTPREYVRLLAAGSAQREGLARLTALLERAWYGLRPAGEAEFAEARASFERLAGPERPDSRPGAWQDTGEAA
jgi:hypothetical protein